MLLSRHTIASVFVIVLLSHFFAISYAQNLNWVTVYQSNWAAPEMPLNVYDWRGITHMIHFNIEPKREPPYYYFPQGQAIFEGGGWSATGDGYQRALIDSARANGVKMILCIGGIGNDNQATYAWIADDSVRCETAMRSILGYARQKGYDGVDFDIEGWNHPTPQQFERLSRFTRRILDEWTPRGILTIAVGRDYESSKPVWVLNAYYDQINTMNYDCNGYWSSGTGFHAPLYNPSRNYPWYPSESGALNTHDRFSTWLTAGVLPSKLGLGLAAYGWGWTSATAPGQRRESLGSFNNYYVWHNEIVNDYLDRGRGTRYYDTLAHQPWISNPGGPGWSYINYDDEQSLPKKVEYARQRGLGGVMVFTYNSQYNKNKPVGQRHPLIKAIRESITPPTPSAPSILAHPVNRSVLIGETATFLVQASGYPLPSYQWQKNGINISGATGPSYTTPATVLGDNGTTYRCVVTNTLGSVTSSSATLTVSAPVAANPISDDFSDPNRTSTTWRKSHPALITHDGLGTSDAVIKFTLGATAHDMWGNEFNAPRLLQSITNGNFEVVAKFETVPTSTYQWQGILVRESATSWIRFDILRDNYGLKFFAATLNGTNSTERIHTSITLSSSLVWMKINRTGNVWTASLSTNNSTYTQAGQFAHSMVVDSIGVYAGNSANNGTVPPFVSKVDYFFNTSSPINPEDPVSGAPVGQFMADLDTLPVGGGNVTLSWTSTNALSASIDQGIGSVALNGSRTVSINQTTTFTLTLTNAVGSQSYTKTVAVALPGGGGNIQDITSNGIPIAYVMAPTGAGNKNIEVIRDGVIPIQGSTNVNDQYDTYNGGGTRPIDWIGYSYTSTQRFGSLFFQEGIRSAAGGHFAAQPRVEVRVAGQWVEATNISITPTYNTASAPNFSSYTLRFDPVYGDAIRIIGTPAGTDKYISVAELRVFAAPTSSVPPTNLPKNFDLMANFPNPFNPSTTFEFAIPHTSHVTIAVYDMLGQHVRTLVDRVLDGGAYPVVWDGRNANGDVVTSGVYLYRMNAADFTATRKMVFSK